MIKSIIHIFLSTLLITAILAPSVVTLIDIDCKSLSLMELSDDESKKENKKEFSEKNVFFHILENGISPLLSLKTSTNPFYLEKRYTHIQDIFLPPPKHTI